MAIVAALAVATIGYAAYLGLGHSSRTSAPEQGSSIPLTPEACESMGGYFMGDPGNGSVRCGAGEDNLGFVTFGFEGGICCR